MESLWQRTRRRGADACADSFLLGLHIIRTRARAAVSSNTAPLDDSKIGALLSLDQAMEAVAARVTPAIVNVAVTSGVKSQPVAEGIPDDMQHFFGQQFRPTNAATAAD